MISTEKHLVYIGHGPVKIVSKQEKTVAGSTQLWITLQCLTNNMKIIVLEKDLKSKTRPLSSKVEAKKIQDYLNDESVVPKVSKTTWNRRYRAAQDRLRDGRLDKIAEVLKELNHLSLSKELSFGEKKMKEVAKSLLDTEISLVLK